MPLSTQRKFKPVPTHPQLRKNRFRTIKDIRNLLRVNGELQFELRSPLVKGLPRGSYALFKAGRQYSAYLNRDEFIRWFNDTLANQLVPK